MSKRTWITTVLQILKNNGRKKSSYVFLQLVWNNVNCSWQLGYNVYFTLFRDWAVQLSRLSTHVQYNIILNSSVLRFITFSLSSFSGFCLPNYRLWEISVRRLKLAWVSVKKQRIIYSGFPCAFLLLLLLLVFSMFPACRSCSAFLNLWRSFFGWKHTHRGVQWGKWLRLLYVWGDYELLENEL